jgi:hypothetical protein
LSPRIFNFDLTHWTTWLALGVGLAVAILVIFMAILYGRWRRRRRLAFASVEEDLPWDDLLEMLQARSRQQPAPGLPRDDEVPPDKLLKQLLAELPYRRRPANSPENFVSRGGVEQRASPRRWGNPTEVHLTWTGGPARLHGLVVNRSTGGLAIFVDEQVLENTVVEVRPTAAPYYVPTITIEVRHCLKVSRNFLLGCRFCSEVPWNVRVWLG